MNSHKNARLMFEGRKLLIERIAVMGLVPAAQAAGISLCTARKWLNALRNTATTLSMVEVPDLNVSATSSMNRQRSGWINYVAFVCL